MLLSSSITTPFSVSSFVEVKLEDMKNPMPPVELGFREICRSIFRISKYMGAFPFDVSMRGLRKNYYSAFGSLVYGLLAVLLVITIWIQHFDWNKSMRDIIFYLFCIPRLLSLLIIPIANFMLLASKKKLEKLISALLRIKTAMGAPEINCSDWRHYLLLFLQCVFMLTEVSFCILEAPSQSFISKAFLVINFFGNLGSEVILIMQFCSILTGIRSLYATALRDLNIITAETLTKCHEVLGSCCKILMDIYSIPLLCFIASVYFQIVLHIYVIVMKIKEEDLLGAAFGISWAVHESFLIWFLIFHCRDSILKAKEFDNLLYRMVIHDDSKVLVRNKRIKVHYKEKRIEEFSVLGLFNLDYPLICSMVSSATTYIVILVQFS